MHEIYEGVLMSCLMTDHKNFCAACVCEICEEKFGQDPMLKKVWDHCHISGKFRYALCSSFNLTWAKRPFQVNVFFTALAIRIHTF